jgi:hypothetical protein
MEYFVVYICLLAGGIIQVLCFFVLLYFSRKSKQWPTTMGQILSSKISSLGSNYEDMNKSYKAVIRYQYQVQDEIHVSDRLHYGDWIATDFSSYAKKVVTRYKEGCECIVHYDPQKPQDSVLETTLGLSTYLLLVGGILFILIDIVLLLCRGMFVF